MMTIRERATRFCDAVGVSYSHGEVETVLRAAIEEFRVECMGKCLAVQTTVSHIDHQRDFDRGESAAAGHIMRGIREITVQ